MHVDRDPFARGEYERTTIPNRKKLLSCAWCGQARVRLYTYQWQRDDRTQPPDRNLRPFCTLQCHKCYYG